MGGAQRIGLAQTALDPRIANAMPPLPSTTIAGRLGRAPGFTNLAGHSRP